MHRQKGQVWISRATSGGENDGAPEAEKEITSRAKIWVVTTEAAAKMCSTLLPTLTSFLKIGSAVVNPAVPQATMSERRSVALPSHSPSLFPVHFFPQARCLTCSEISRSSFPSANPCTSAACLNAAGKTNSSPHTGLLPLPTLVARFMLPGPSLASDARCTLPLLICSVVAVTWVRC